MPIVWKSWSLKLLETYGFVQACNGIALPLFNAETNVEYLKGRIEVFPRNPKIIHV
jgi:hypothetical protein